MKLIKLLNIIANNEKIPSIIRYNKKVYHYDEFVIGYGETYFDAKWKITKGYRHRTNDNTFIYLTIRDYNLNDEIEIIEE